MPTVRRLAFFAALAMPLWSALAVPPEPGFWLIGLQPDGKDGQVRGLTRDGAMGTGTNTLTPTGSPGFTWTREGGRFDFGSLPGMPIGTPAMGLSDNGVVVGATGFSTGVHAYRWPGSGPLEDLGPLPGTNWNGATGVSGDGKVVVGYGESGSMGGFSGQAFRWTPSGGMQGLGWLKPGSIRSQANGVSRDGSTIVGRNMDFNLTDEAFIWTEATGMKALPNLPNALLSAEARAVNADGSVVVGSSYSSANVDHAVRWTPQGIEDLTIGSAFTKSRAFGVNDQGNVVGGVADHAFIWSPQTRMMDATDYLALHGVSVPNDYQIEIIYAVSGDGLTFGGSARNLLTNKTEGWVATIPGPNTCPPDCDENTKLSIDDFICFQTYFALDDAKADCDESGTLSIDDFICFQTGFAIGC